MSEETAREPDEFELSAGDKKIRVKGADVIGVLNLIALTLLVFGGWTHIVDAKEESKTQTVATQENTRAIREQSGEMRVANCFAALTVEQKRAPEMVSFCKSLASAR